MPKVFLEQEREIIRMILLNAGIEELENKSYRNIAVDDLAAKGTFYNFFLQKKHIFMPSCSLSRIRTETN